VSVAVDAARTAGAVLLSRWERRGAGLQTKTTSTDVVLDADRAAEAEVVKILRTAYPHDAIVAEEGSGAGASSSGFRWFVDPLDGTVNYLYGIPHYAVAIACEDADGLLASAVYDPSRDELFTAARGAGAWLRTARLGVSGASDLAQSLVATGFAYVADARAEQARILNGVLPYVRDIRRFGSAQLDLAYVATGRHDAYFESVDKPWDWKAGALLVREAGGRVSELPQARAGHPHIAASAPLIHDALVTLLQRAVQSR
jgi:myo-inositol-1(or 4)-monophosphatase